MSGGGEGAVGWEFALNLATLPRAPQESGVADAVRNCLAVLDGMGISMSQQGYGMKRPKDWHYPDPGITQAETGQVDGKTSAVAPQIKEMA